MSDPADIEVTVSSAAGPAWPWGERAAVRLVDQIDRVLWPVRMRVLLVAMDAAERLRRSGQGE